MKTKLLLAMASLMLAASQAHALVIFEDNFDSENGGTGALNYTGFSNWTVSNGSVDLIGNGFYDMQPGNGLYVDMDGTISPPDAGKIQTISSFLLAAGKYVLSYSLAGNQRNGSSEQVDVRVDVGLASISHSLSQNAPFQTFELDFTVASATNATISFEGLHGDNVGMLLDNVKLERVPDSGATLALLAMGLVSFVSLRRWKR